MTNQRTIFRTFSWTLVAAVLVVATASAQAPEEIPLGSEMPSTAVQLNRVSGGQATLGGLQGDAGTVVLFWSNQCPWVEKYEDRFVGIVNDYTQRGVNFVIINSNDPNAYPQEAAEAGAQRFSSAGYPAGLAYLSDSTSEVALAFGAQRTPHVYVFDSAGSLAYVGTIDDSPGDPANVKQQYLRLALDAVLGGSSIAVPKTKAFGCTIKFTN